MLNRAAPFRGRAVGPTAKRFGRPYTILMRIALLSGGDGWHVRDLVRAAADLGHAAEPVDFRRVFAAMSTPVADAPGSPSDTPDLDAFDAVIVRTMPPGSLEQVVFRMDRLHALAARGVP